MTEPLTLKEIFGEPSYRFITEPNQDTTKDTTMCSLLDDIKKVGSGSYGDVYLTTNKIAIKNFKNKRSEFEDFADIDIGSRIRHPNITRIYTVITDNVCDVRKNYVSTVMDYFPKTLESLIDDKVQFNYNNIQTQLLQGLEFLHRAKILHLDIKPENILYNPIEQRASIADFGLCSYSKEIRANHIGTMSYMNPYSLKNKLFNEESDVWSMGITLASLKLKQHIGDIIYESVKKSKSRPEDEDYVYRKSSLAAAKEILPLLPVMFKYMIGDKILPVAELMRRYGIKKLDGTVIVEPADDIPEDMVPDALKCFSLAKKINDLEFRYSVLHLAYVSIARDISVSPEDRFYFCRYIIDKTISAEETQIPGNKNYIPFRNLLIAKTNGCLKTYNPFDYATSRAESYIFQKYFEDPKNYFYNLSRLTYRLPPK